MKNKVLIIICAIMVLVPWTILPLRVNFQWALDYAHIMIPCYAVFMIFGAIFTTFTYVKVKAQNTLMKISLVINGMYGVFGIGAIAMISAAALNWK